jgi:hypothetical protein
MPGEHRRVLHRCPDAVRDAQNAIIVRTVDTEGNSIEGARVDVLTGRGWVIVSLSTGYDGTAVVDQELAAVYALRVRAEGFAERVVFIEEEERAARSMTIQLQLAGVISGLVELVAPHQTTANMVALVQCNHLGLGGTVKVGGGSDRVGWTSEVQQSGTFRFEDVPVGWPLFLTVWQGDTCIASYDSGMVLRPGEEERVHVLCGVPQPCTGRVIDQDGKPIAGLLVWGTPKVWANWAEGPSRSNRDVVVFGAISAEDGTFECPSRPTGDWYFGPAPAYENSTDLQWSAEPGSVAIQFDPLVDDYLFDVPVVLKQVPESEEDR